MISKSSTLKILLKINYKTVFGENLFVSGSGIFGDWKEPLKLNPKNDGSGDWELTLETFHHSPILQYKYFVAHQEETVWEGGQNREINPEEFVEHEHIEVRDLWLTTSSPEATYFNTSLFRNVIFHRENSTPHASKIVCSGVKTGHVIIKFDVLATVVAPNCKVYVVGSNELIGNWDHTKGLALSDTDYPHWKGQIVLPKEYSSFSYKYVIFNPEGPSSQWEQGSNRFFNSNFDLQPSNVIILHDGEYKGTFQWRGAGVAVPIFSLRTNDGLGVGEFLDLKHLVDWATKVSLSLIQILPISDTTVFGDFRDSYPYSAVSVFALHPLYLRIDKITKDPQILKQIETKRADLNKLAKIDFVEVINFKTSLLRKIFDATKSILVKEDSFQKFFKDNKEWLEPYALFSHFRDRFGTYEFPNWPEYSTITKAQVSQLSSPNSKIYDELFYHFFVQFHLHTQLLEASEYAKAHRIGLKGDLPIGVNRYSVDTWISPHLFKMQMSTGAPPDAFSADGQNWGFPTYNWDEMAKDNYAWWGSRLGQMAKYFHAFRIDHILGFFRIWEIPGNAVTGLFGRFNPSQPLHIDELRSVGVWDFHRLTQPYIRPHLLFQYFGERAYEVQERFLQSHPSLQLQFKPEFASEKQVAAALSEKDKWMKEGLFRLLQNVILLKEGETEFYPRIEMHKTSSFNELEDGLKLSLKRLYISYFYERQEHLWATTALKRLPIIKSCTDMLVCGEDLGMVPKCVTPVLHQLGILGLRIQRMPSDAKLDFYNPFTYDYLTVCASSSHDTSTLRGWWEEDRALSQKFYNNILGFSGAAPYFCETYVTQSVLHGHLNSPSMLAVLPIQDILGLDASLSNIDPKEQRINEPSNPTHYWRYRLHIDLEGLQNNTTFNNSFKFLVESSGRKVNFLV